MGRPVAWWWVVGVGVVVDGKEEVMNGVRMEKKSSIFGLAGCHEIVFGCKGLTAMDVNLKN